MGNFRREGNSRAFKPPSLTRGKNRGNTDGGSKAIRKKKGENLPRK